MGVVALDRKIVVLEKRWTITHFVFSFSLPKVISSFDMMIYFSSLCLQISRHLHLSIFKTSCQQAPEQVHKHIDWLVAQGKEEKQLGEPMYEGNPPMQEASILSIRLC